MHSKAAYCLRKGGVLLGRSVSEPLLGPNPNKSMHGRVLIWQWGVYL